MVHAHSGVNTMWIAGPTQVSCQPASTHASTSSDLSDANSGRRGGAALDAQHEAMVKVSNERPERPWEVVADYILAMRARLAGGSA